MFLNELSKLRYQLDFLLFSSDRSEFCVLDLKYAFRSLLFANADLLSLIHSLMMLKKIC